MKVPDRHDIPHLLYEGEICFFESARSSSKLFLRSSFNVKKRLLQKSERNFSNKYRVNVPGNFGGFFGGLYLRGKNFHPKIHNKVQIRIWEFRSRKIQTARIGGGQTCNN